MRFYLNTVLILLLCIQCITGYSEELRALFACDTLSDIKVSTRHDVANLTKALQTIAKHTNLSLKIDTLEGKELTLHRLNAKIDSYRGKNNGVVLFYYSGHGYRTDRMTSIWPRLFFPAKKERIFTEEITQRLQSLGARLVIVLLDCCNNPAIVKSRAIVLQVKGVVQPKNLPGLKTLFLVSRGHIIASGSSPGGFSFSYKTGSIFTSSFIDALSDRCLSEHTSWQAVMEQTIARCAPVQHPIYRIRD